MSSLMRCFASFNFQPVALINSEGEMEELFSLPVVISKVSIKSSVLSGSLA